MSMLSYIQQYVTELSKYAITICMIFYVLECLAAAVPFIKDRSGIYMRQTFWIFAMQMLCYLNLAVVSSDLNYAFFCAFVQAFLAGVLIISNVFYKDCDRLLLNHMCLLLGIGLCMISRLSFQKALKQYVIVLISTAIAMLIPLLLQKVIFLKKLMWLYGLLGIFLLGGVLILGEVTHGSKITFTIQGITFQPSEFVKIIFVFFLAAALWEKTSFGRVVFTAVLAAAQIIILVVSRDLGSALIFFVTYVFVVFAATRNYLYLLLGTAGGSAAAIVAYQLFDHIRVRVLAWQDPWSFIDNQGYQITQSLFAIGSGSWFGMGLLQGNPAAIPYVEADFIFSSVCEEFGVVFGICLILVCISCFMTIIAVCLRVSDRFYRLLAYGLGIMYIFQIFLTIGGGIKFIPLTGVTLPFVSYGGSSVIKNMFMFWIIQTVNMIGRGEGRIPDEQKK